MAEHVRCGKPNCRCRHGDKHGPYWYLYYRRLEKGAWRLRKRYVPRKEVDAVREQLAAAKARDAAMASLLSQSQRLRGAIRRRQRGQITDTELEEVSNAILEEQAAQLASRGAAR